MKKKRSWEETHQIQGGIIVIAIWILWSFVFPVAYEFFVPKADKSKVQKTSISVPGFSEKIK